MMKVLVLGLPVIVLATATPLCAQGDGILASGIAYDSLRQRPIAGALVALQGTKRSAITDDAGHFSFANAVPGELTIVIEHESLDSVGLSGLSRRATVRSAQDTIRVFVPSFGTLWRSACGTAPPAADTGFIHGVVRDARSARVVPGARVEVSWMDLSYGQLTGIRQKRRRAVVNAGADGAYGMCGVPTNAALSVQAITDSSASGVIHVGPEALRVVRRNFLLGDLADSAAVGTIVGTLMGSDGSPIVNARIQGENVGEMRSDETGAFRIPAAPVGTREIEISALGMRPVVAAVDVVAGDTVRVVLQLHKVATLDAVNVTAPAYRQRLVAEFTERRKMGLGVFKDSTTLGTYGTVINGLRDARSVTIVRERLIYLPGNKPGGCLANIWIDGKKSDQEEFLRLRPDELAAIEVYSRISSTPAQFLIREAKIGSRGAERGLCGSVVVWTKRAFP